MLSKIFTGVFNPENANNSVEKLNDTFCDSKINSNHHGAGNVEKNHCPTNENSTCISPIMDDRGYVVFICIGGNWNVVGNFCS